MDYVLVVLWVVSIAVRVKKCERRGNVRTIKSLKTIDAANNAMIYLYFTWKIRINRINGRNGINGEPGMIWSHVGNLVCTLNQEPMGFEFSECRLAYMDGDVPVFLF